MLRRTWSVFSHASLALLAVFALAGATGCRSERVGPKPPDDQAELWALLRDGELKGPALGALSESALDAGDRAAADAQTLDGVSFGKWTFDDCNASRTNLSDANF